MHSNAAPGEMLQREAVNRHIARTLDVEEVVETIGNTRGAAIEKRAIDATWSVVLPRLATVGRRERERAREIVGPTLDVGGLDRAVLHRLLRTLERREGRVHRTRIVIVPVDRNEEPRTSWSRCGSRGRRGRGRGCRRRDWR